MGGDAIGDFFHLAYFLGERCRELLAGGREVGVAAGEDSLRDVGGLHADGKLVSCAGGIRDRIERSDCRRKSRSGELKISLTVLGVLFQVFVDAGGCANCLPVNAGVIGNHHKTIYGVGRGNDLRQQIGLPGIVGVLDHGRTNVRCEILFLCQRVVFMKKRQHLLGCHPQCVFRKWLGGDPDSFNLIACFDKFGARAVEKRQCLFNLGTIRLAIQTNESSDGSDLCRRAGV